ncbi:TPA: hypothetical protein WH709_002114, partial [Neisseria meningitidis]
PTAVIPAQAGIQRRNATGIYRKKQNPPTAVIPAKAGIQQPKNHRNLSAKTETPPPSFPQKRESSNRKTTGIYQQKQKPHRRHSRKSGNPKTQRNRNPSEKTETPPTVIPAKAGIQQPKNHRNLSAKTETPTASFPQKLESKNATQQEFIGKNRNPTDRHSRKSGNPDPSARNLTG